MKLTSEQFGQMALQLISQAQVQGDSLDAALAFREMARAIASGKIIVSEADADHGPSHSLRNTPVTEE